MSIRAGVDVGGSGVRAIIEMPGGRREARLERPNHRRAVIDAALIAEAAAAAVAHALAGDGLQGVDAVGIGATGFPDLIDDPAEVTDAVRRRLGARRVVIAGDALTTHLGALGGAAGTVVAAGTGVIALGTDLESRWNRADGWGHLLGDEGGGAWIGRRGLMAALRHTDGRTGGSERLAAAMAEQFGDAGAVLDRVYRGVSPSYELAGFAPAVGGAARDGDPVAVAIWQQAGTLIAEAAAAASRGLDPLFSWGGGLFRNGELLERPFRKALTALLPEARIASPAGDAADGALLLLDHPVSSRTDGPFLHAPSDAGS